MLPTLILSLITMSKSSQSEIERDEKKVIHELQKNSKESIDNIAKNCGFSRQKVWRIIKRLEKNKTIWGYCVAVDDFKLDMKQYFVLLKRTNKPISQEAIDLIVDRNLRKESEKMGVYSIGSYFVHGYFDWIINIKAADIVHAKKFIELFSTRFDQFISDIKLLEVIFPITKNGIDNPKVGEFSSFF